MSPGDGDRHRLPHPLVQCGWVDLLKQNTEVCPSSCGPGHLSTLSRWAQLLNLGPTHPTVPCQQETQLLIPTYSLGYQQERPHQVLSTGPLRASRVEHTPLAMLQLNFGPTKELGWVASARA